MVRYGQAASWIKECYSSDVGILDHHTGGEEAKSPRIGTGRKEKEQG